MKTNEQYLELQAYADGQLDQLEGLPPGRRAELERMMADDAEARGLVEGVRSLSQLVRANEPVHTVPASREFYWSQIQRKIDSAERAGTRAQTPASPRGFWLRWWLPVLGASAVAVTSFLVSVGGLPITRAFGETAVSDRGSDSSGAVVFRSESEGVTICWLD